MNIREATRGDNAALCALEHRTPLVIDETPIVVGDDNFFGKHELQERTVVMLAEESGEVVGVCAGALVRAPLAGGERQLLYIHHERIAPEHQRKGLGGVLTRAVSDYWKAHDAGHIDSSYWYIATGNSRSRAFAERSGNRPWPEPMYLLHLAPGPSPGRPRRVGAGPTYDIVRLINGTHAGEELFRPYEHVDFGQRLSWSTAYGWGDIYGRFEGDRLVAVAGLWHGTVADYGFEPGAEGHMLSLLSDLAAVADGLYVLIGPRQPLFAELAQQCDEKVEFLFYTPRIDTPANPAPIYVDPVYF